MKWEPVLEKLEIRGFTPETASHDPLKRKEKLRKRIKDEIDTELNKIKKRTINRPLFIDVCYYLYLADASGSSKKDLDNLLKILFDVLSVNMVNGQDEKKGLGLMKDDSYVQKIKCEKKLVNKEEKQGFDLLISRGS